MVNKIFSYFRQWRQPHILPVFYILFLTIGELAALVSILASRSEGKRAFFFGYSLQKILLGAGLVLLFAIFVALTIKLIRQPNWSRQLWEKVFVDENIGMTFLLGVFVVFCVCWIVLFLPYYRFAGNLAGYVSQLRSIIVWLAVVSGATMLFVLFERGKESIKSIILQNKTALWMGVIIFSLFMLAGVLVFSTGIGARKPEDYWYGTGVPIMGLQIFFALLAGAFWAWMEPKKSLFKNDVLICLVLWIVTAWLWARQPILPNYFMPDTSKNIMYPYSDSATFDTASQYALIGQGLFNSQFFDRSLYSALLTFLHMIFGQNYSQILTTQAIIYAVFPFIIYLLMKEMHGRALGIFSALLVLLRGLTALVGATWIDLASPKMILTDFPTAIGVALFILFLVKWLKEPHKGYLALWAGGLLGMTLMLRTHVLLLLPFVLAYIILVGWKMRWNYRIVASIALIIGMLAATTPWDIRNHSKGLPMFYMYYARIQTVLRDRYGIKGGSYVPSLQPSVVAVPHIVRSRVASQEHNLYPFQEGNCTSRACVITNHVFHNLITSVLFFPTSLELHSLWNIIKEGPPFWAASWKGEGVSVSVGILLAINLALISLGVGVLWARNKLLGLLPVVIYLAYILSNALALTSGGRYITPVDWIMCVYYAAGLLQVASWVMRKAGISHHFEDDLVDHEANVAPAFSMKYSSLVSTLLIVFLLGSLVPISEMPFERRYKASSADDVLAVLEQQGMFENTGVEKEDVSTFLADPEAKVLIGRLLYPRYYAAGDGEEDRHYPYVHLDYPRNVFLVVGPLDITPQAVIIAGDRSEFFTHAADVVVIGCKNKLNVDGLAVFVISRPGYVYFRSPQPEWKCPMPTP